MRKYLQIKYLIKNLYTKLQKNPQDSIIRKQPNFKMDKPLNSHFTKEHLGKAKQAYEKMVNITNHFYNAN